MNFSKERSRWWSGTCYHHEQLEMIISHLDVKDYAYALHDKDLKEDDSGELKKPHWHFIINLVQPQRGSWFKAFGSDDMGHVYHQASRCPEGAYNYLIHDTNHARKQGKYQYDPDIRVSTIDKFDEPREEDEHQVLLDDIRALRRKEITWDDLVQRKPKRIHMMANISNTYEKLCREERFDNVFRELTVTYIFGQTDKGKTRHVMDKYGYRNVFRVTKYDRTAFDGYVGQDVVVFEEFRSSFKVEEMLNYLDGYPLQLPSRYNDKEAAYTKVYIITNWALSEQYRNIQSEHPTTWQAFARRIHAVHDFDGNKALNLKHAPTQTELPMTPITDRTELASLPF